MVMVTGLTHTIKEVRTRVKNDPIYLIAPSKQGSFLSHIGVRVRALAR
jgi:hypothetical protein